MQTQATAAAQALTHETATQAFADWESDFRADPESFYTREETAAMEIADLSEQRAIHFVALLRSQGYGSAEKSAPAAIATVAAIACAPPPVGQHWPGQGGVYIGICRGEDGQPAQHVIVATGPEASFKGVWGKYDQDVPGAKHRFDGRANTQAMAAAGSKIAKSILTLTLEGHNDWFIGSQAQHALACANAPEIFASGYHWTSTQSSRSNAFVQVFEDGGSGWSFKGSEWRVRAFRGFPLESFNTSTEGTAS